TGAGAPTRGITSESRPRFWCVESCSSGKSCAQGVTLLHALGWPPACIVAQMRKHAMFDQAFDRNSHWTTPTRAFHAPLREKVDIDVVVVGGGITGITAAHLLKQRGLRVALLERHRCGYGQSSRTSAHLTAVPDVP